MAQIIKFPLQCGPKNRGFEKVGPGDILYSSLSPFSFLLKQPSERNCRCPLIFSPLPPFQTHC